MKSICKIPGYAAAAVIATLLSSACERDNFSSDYKDMYGEWTIRSISGGFTGMGYEPDFDILSINRSMKYSIYRNDTLLSSGNINIIEQTSDNLRVDFRPKKNHDELSGFKNVSLRPDTMVLNDDCCDMFSYFFIRSEVFLSDSYIQTDKTIDFVEVASYPIGFNKFYTSVCFQNEEMGFITCYDGSILKTSDGGRNWKITQTNNTLPLYGVAFIDDKIGYAGGGKSSCGGTGCVVPGYLILKTVDGGESWSKVDIPYNYHEFNVIKFANRNTGLALGTGICMRTDDGGLSWENINIPNLFSLCDLFFLNEDIAYISGISGKLFKTTDSGITWNDISLNEEFPLYSIMFFNEQIGYIGKYDGLIKTTDGGLAWNNIVNSPKAVRKMCFTSENDGIVFGTRTYASSKWDVWDSYFNILIDGKWYGDARVKSHITPFCLNPEKYYTITPDDKILAITLNMTD